MDLKTFAEKYRVHTRIDSCGDTIIPGKQFCKDMPTTRQVNGRPEPIVEYRSHIYDGFADGRLGLCLLLATIRRWTHARKTLEAAGFTIKQNGDQEGCALFDPDNPIQARLALKLAGIKTRRHIPNPSPAQLAARQKFLANAEAWRSSNKTGTSEPTTPPIP
jgi:hypothetical protein